MILVNQTYRPTSLISAPKIHTDLLWDLSFLFIGLAAVYFIFVFFYRNRLSKRAEREKQRKRELSPMISEFLFHEIEASKDEKSNYVNLKIEIRQLLKDDFNRKILSEILLDLRKDVAGDTQKRLLKLYQDLGLHTDAFKKLKSWRWEIVSKAILDLTQMQVAKAYRFVTKFINDKRPTIRKQAEIAVVTLKPEGINYFLDTTKYKISEWQQLKILDVLRMDDSFQPPRFKAWLTSSNRHVVLFALRLIKYYNQNDAEAALIELVKHKHNQIKEAAIDCIKEFHFTKAIPVLKVVFWKSSIDVKIAILDAIGVLGEETDIEFLTLIEKKESNFSVKSKAYSSINAIAPDSIMPSKGIANTANYVIPADIIVKEQKEEEEAVNEIESLVEPNETNTSEDEIFEASNEILNNDENSIMVEDQERTPSDNTKNNVNSTSNSKEIELLSLDFLPIVIQEITENNTNNSEKENSIDALSEMTIDFEEVIPEKEIQPLIDDTYTVEISEEELAFLPVVTDALEDISIENNAEDNSPQIDAVHDIEVQFDEVISIPQNENLETPIDYSQYAKQEILDINVIYDDINIPSLQINEPLDKTQSDSFPWFSIENSPEDTVDIQSNINLPPKQSNDNMTPEEEQKFKQIIDDLIDFNPKASPDENTEQHNESPLLEFGNEFVDISDFSEEIEEGTKQEIETNSLEEIKDNTQKEVAAVQPTIPLAVFDDVFFEDIILYKENTEESRMQLLDDIAAMGDHREIALLNELLINEKYRTVKDRIKSLIEKFSETEQQPEPDTSLKPFNVFEDLFRICDTEAKLILMDEIVAVGDEQEIDFLEELLEKEEEVIKQKANQILTELKAKLSISNEDKAPEITSSNLDNLEEEEGVFTAYDSLMEVLEIEPPKADDTIFAIDFELTESLQEIEDREISEELDKTKSNQASFFGQICSFSHKIIDKFNG